MILIAEIEVAYELSKIDVPILVLIDFVEDEVGLPAIDGRI
jgi:hypothetical protein